MVAHPTNDPTLPSYLHPAYVEMQEDFMLVWDCWHSLKGNKGSYLPKEESEPSKAYSARLGRSQFDNRFTPAIKGHAGLLSNFTLTDETPNSIKDNEKNIDLQGSDLATFFTEVDEIAMRDGGCGILVEFPTEDRDIASNGDLLDSGRHPYLVAIDRRDILNWDVVYLQGKPFIRRVIIRERVLQPAGEFGVEEVIYYRVLSPGQFVSYQLRQVDGKWLAVIVPERCGTTSLSMVPLVWYSVSNSKLFQGDLPFLNLARLNVEHLQKRSSLNEVIHKCNMPVPVRKGLVKSVGDLIKGVVKLVIGPNSVVDVPQEGDFYFAEPKGTAIASTQADIAKLEGAMDRVSLAFLTGGEAQKTATEVILDTAQTQATLKGMARRKESCSQQIFQLWTLYTEESTSGSLDVNESVLQIPATAQEVQTILDAMGVQISRELALKMLLERQWLPADTDLKQELRFTEVPDKPDPTPDPKQIEREASLFPSVA